MLQDSLESVMTVKETYLKNCTKEMVVEFHNKGSMNMNMNMDMNMNKTKDNLPQKNNNIIKWPNV